ncbi:MAG: glycosyltransferase family 2 protein [Bacteroidia bacterium]
MFVSIVTVTYNPGELLEPTMRSVAEQVGVQIDYVVVDGASKDGTVERLRAFGKRIEEIEADGGQDERNQLTYRWVSEPDRGLYDAMNKGLAMASGDYVLFLNAGDTLAHPRVLADLWSERKGAAVYYGQAMVVESMGGRELGLRKPLPPQHLNWRSLRFGMVVSHQAFVIKRERALPYDLQYRICADIDWMIRCLRALGPGALGPEVVSSKALGVHFADRVLVHFLDGGLSSQRRKAAWKERFLIMSRHYGPLNNLLNHGWIVIRYVLRRFVPNFA